jgi:hypothetical protein
MRIHSYSTPYSQCQCQCQLHQCAHTLVRYQDYPSCNPVGLLTSFFSIFQALLYVASKLSRKGLESAFAYVHITELGLLLQGPCLLAQMQCGGISLDSRSLSRSQLAAALHVHIIGRALLVGLGNDGLLGC